MRWLAAAALTIAATAHADTWTDDGDPAHPAVVRAKLTGQVATFAVRYIVKVDGPLFETYAAGLDLPVRGSLNHATVTIGGRSHALELRDASSAGEAFGAIQNLPGETDRRWGVLLSKTSGTVQVSVAAPHGAFLTFDLEITAPTCFAKDARFVEIPKAWTAVLDTGLRSALTTTDRVGDTCAAGAAEDAAWLGFSSRELALHPAGDGRIGAAAGKLALGDDHDLVRAELDLAGTVSEIPRDLATVFVVDGSRSMTAGQIAAQRALIAAYVAKAPESRIQVIAFARTVRPLLPGWMTAGQAAARIDRELGALAPRNGSNIDLAIAAGGDWLARTTGTRRMIVISDDAMAHRISEIAPVTLKRLLPEHTLVHAITAVDATGLTRSDDIHFGPLAIATDGMGVTAGRLDETSDITMLLRPITLDQIEVRAGGWTAIAPMSSSLAPCGDSGSLHEGDSCTWWGHGDDVAGPVTIEGLLWGHRVVRTLAPDPARHRELARELSADGSFSGLEASEQARIESLAFAVNSAWSMFAAWGGGDGYTDLGGFATCSCCGGTSSIGTRSMDTGVGVARRQPPLQLAAQLAPAVATCHPGDAKITATVETTFQETVDVGVEIALPHGDAARQATLHDCIEEAIWDVALMIPHAPSHAVTKVAFP